MQTNMGIEDYINNVSGRLKVFRQDMKTQSNTPSESSSKFNGILSTFKRPVSDSAPKELKGMTLDDYRKHSSIAVPYYVPLTPPGAVSAPSSKPQESSSATPGVQPAQNIGAPSSALPVRKSMADIKNSLYGYAPAAEKISTFQRSSGNTQCSEAIENAIQEAAARYQLPHQLIKGVIEAESNYDSTAVSPAGAQGLMQLMPGTARDLGVTQPFDIRQNIDGGVRYLRKMMDLFGGNVRKALAAYNAGPETVKRYNGNVPFSETRQYVNRVLNNLDSEV
jgi:soluble lytic murein transglycosylase-like protein